MQQYVQLKAKDVCRKAITLEPNKTLGDARNTMLRYNLSRIVVAKGLKPVGIVTEKSIGGFLYRDTINRPLDEIRLDQVISKDVRVIDQYSDVIVIRLDQVISQDLITVSEETDLKTCAQMMLDKQISSLLVIDDNGNLQGIFTKSDLVDVYYKHYEGKNLVQDYMTKKVFTVSRDHSIHTVIAIMIKNRVSRVVVVKGQKPIGIITGRDLLPVSTLIEADIHGMPSEVLMSRRQSTTPLLSGITHVLLARDVMKCDPITVTSDSDLADAAQIMINSKISGLPVVDSDNNLIGIVTKTDVVRALA